MDNGWSFLKTDKDIEFVPRAIIEDSKSFEDLIKKYDLKYFVFRFRAPQLGILAAARKTIAACEWISQYNIIPYIDFEWGYNYDCKTLGKDNFFNYVFEQNVDIEEIWNSNLICGDINWEYMHDMEIRYSLFGNRIDTRPNCVIENYREYYRKLNVYSNKWLVVREDLNCDIINKIRKLQSEGKRIMGLAVREGFTQNDSQLKAENLFMRHPKEPSVQDNINSIYSEMEKNDCEFLFVTAQTKDTIEYLKEKFKDKLLYLNRERPSLQDFYVAALQYAEGNIERDTKKDYDFFNTDSWESKIVNNYTFDRMRDYVSEIRTLAVCDAMMGGKSSGTLMACIWNGGKYDSIALWSDKHNSPLY